CPAFRLQPEDKQALMSALDPGLRRERGQQVGRFQPSGDLRDLADWLRSSRGASKMAFWVYMLASKRNGTLYTGHTDNLPHRTWQHKEGQTPGFASKYGVKILVWIEAHSTRESAKTRERQIK